MTGIYPTHELFCSNIRMSITSLLVGKFIGGYCCSIVYRHPLNLLPAYKLSAKLYDSSYNHLLHTERIVA